MAQVVVDGLIVNYQKTGKGETVVLLHGWGDSAAGLSNVAKHLSDLYEVVTLDLPGFGASETPKNQPWRLNDYANFVQHFLEKINRPDIFALIGHSNGGAIAIIGTAHKVISPQKLVLLSSSGIRDTKSKAANFKKGVIKTGKKASFVLPKKYQQKIRLKVYKNAGSDIMVAPHLEPTFRAIIGQDIQDDAKLITVPTLLVYGRDDTATPPAFGTIYLGHILHSKQIVLDRAGHFVHIDQPQLVFSELDLFLGTQNA